MDVAPTAPHIGTAADAIAHAVIPGPHLTALYVAHPIGTPHIPKGTLHPTGTSRML